VKLARTLGVTSCLATSLAPVACGSDFPAVSIDDGSTNRGASSPDTVAAPDADADAVTVIMPDATSSDGHVSDGSTEADGDSGGSAGLVCGGQYV
jgi:hypothetical protein